MDDKNANFHQPKTERDRFYGSFSLCDIKAYIQHKGWNDAQIAQLKNIKALSLIELCGLLNLPIAHRQFYLIKEGGLAALAFLFEEIQWEIISLDGKSNNYIAAIQNLSKNEAFCSALNPAETMALKILCQDFQILLDDLLD